MPEPVLPPPPPPVRRVFTPAAAATPEPSSADGQLAAARALTALAPVHLASAPSFQLLPPDTQGRILRELDNIQAGLNGHTRAQALGTPMDFRRGGVSQQPTEQQPDQAAPTDSGSDSTTSKRQQATETIARRAGALSDEIDFPAFVAGLIHNTFDAIVDASIRQMEAFADLVSSVARTAEDFARDNVSDNAARDWLASKYPADLRMDLQAEGGPQLVPREAAAKPASADGGDASGGDTPHAPAWLKDFGLEGQELTPELINETLIPKARERVGRDRQQMLATMVLLGMNRVIVKDGTITARLQFRAVAADKSKVDYAVSDDPSGGGSGSNWATRGSSTYAAPSTKVSTLGVNVQSDAALSAQLFGEVKINFASETLPLDRFVDDAKRTLLERHARPSDAAPRPAAPALPAPAATPSLPPPAQLPPPAPVQSAPPPARGG